MRSFKRQVALRTQKRHSHSFPLSVFLVFVQMNPLLDSTIHHAMRETLDKFFDSLHQGAPALLSFLTTLSTFQSTVRTNRDKLRPDTLISISKFSTIISTVSSDMLELETAREAISNNASEIVKVLDHHMEKLSISDEQTVTAANCQ